jgi:N-acetylneuraminic acid mutarotase
MRNSLRSLALLIFVACSDSSSTSPADASVVRDAAFNPRDAAIDDSDSGVPEDALGVWTALADLTEPRQETAVVELGGEIYLIGGYDEQQRIVPAVEAFNPATNTWRAVAALPIAIHHVNAAVTGDRIYIAGHLGPDGFNAGGAVFEYDPAQDAWTQKTSMPAGRERGASAVAVAGGNIFVFGGLRGGSRDEVDVYDPRADKWTSLPPMPRTVDHVVAGAIGQKIYIAGGRNAAGLTARLDIFDPADGTWTEGAPMPTSRAGSAGAVAGQRLYVFGGEGNRAIETGVFAEVEAYDATANTWRVLAPMPTPRHGTGAAAAGGRIYVPGGAVVEGFGAVDALEAFDPPM